MIWLSGGTYTMNDVVDFGARAVTFRGDKVNHPKVTFGESARFDDLCRSENQIH